MGTVTLDVYKFFYIFYEIDYLSYVRSVDLYESVQSKTLVSLLVSDS